MQFFPPIPSLDSGKAANPAISTYATIFKFAPVCVLLGVFVTLWAFGYGPASRARLVDGGILTSGQERKVSGINAPWIIAQVVDCRFTGGSKIPSEWYVANEKLVRESVSLELPFVIWGAELLHDHPISTLIFGSYPIPASVFTKLNAVCESHQNGHRRSANFHELQGIFT